MGTIRARVSDELEKRLEEKVEEIRKRTPLGAEVNNSTVIRGALVDFFEKIDKERKGEREISIKLGGLTIEELRDMNNVMDGFLENLEDKGNHTTYGRVMSLINKIQTLILEEEIKIRESLIKS